ncbi:uncharacterized protein LOC144430737 [Styela clava]
MNRDHWRKRKEHSAPYTDPNDARLKWLTSDFFEYITAWRQRAGSRPDFSGAMLFTKSTEEGLFSTSIAMASLIKDCLNVHKAPYIITRRCNQDCLESYFGHQRCIEGGAIIPRW